MFQGNGGGEVRVRLSTEVEEARSVGVSTRWMTWNRRLPKAGKWTNEATPNTDPRVPGLGRSGVSVGGGGVEVVTAPRAEVGWGGVLQNCWSPVGEQGVHPDVVPLQL